MKKFAPIGIVIALLVVVVVIFNSGGWDIRNAGNDGKTIVAFGDSLVFGTGGDEGGFVTILENRIGREIINLGVPGDTTTDGLARIDEALELDPQVVILLLGGNDAIQRFNSDTTFSNLERIIDRIHSSGSAVLLVGIQGGLIGDKYKRAFEDLAEEKEVAFVPDILDGLFGNAQFMADGIHPNSTGYGLVADKIEPVLQSLIQN